MNYLQSIQEFPLPTTIEQEGDFTDMLQTLVLDRTKIPESIAQGVQEWRQARISFQEAESHQVFTPDELIAAQQLLRRMPVGDAVVEMILDLVRAFRPEEAGASERVRETVAWGPGPRAAQALMMTVRARALLQGRLAPSAEDVIDMARPVLSHRM